METILEPEAEAEAAAMLPGQAPAETPAAEIESPAQLPGQIEIEIESQPPTQGAPAMDGAREQATLGRSLSTAWGPGAGDNFAPRLPMPGYGPGAPIRQDAYSRTRAITPPLTTMQRLALGKAVPPWQLFKYRTQKIVQGGPFTMVMLVLTIWALFGEDLKVRYAEQSADSSFEVFAVVLFIIFMMELVVNSLTQDGYFGSFFWWLDLIAALSMLLDVEVIREAIMGAEETDLTVARAGRAARAGTRAGRLLKMTRLLRVIKLFRTVKRDRTADSESIEEDADSLGSKVAEMTTNKVVCGVLIMLVSFPLLSPTTAQEGAGFSLDAMSNTFNTSICSDQDIACHKADVLSASAVVTCQQAIKTCTDSQSPIFQDLLESFKKKFSKELLEVQFGKDSAKPTHLMLPRTADTSKLRKTLEKHWEGTNAAAALFSDKTSAEDGAVLSIFTTLLVVIVLGAGSFTFGKDATAFSEKIAGPMKALTTDMALVTRLQYEDIKHPFCTIKEVTETQDAFKKMKGAIATFAKYVPKAVVMQIVQSDEAATLGIIDRHMSFFFCDIQGFTTVCEAMNSQPDDLLRFLGDFFAEMAAIVEDTGGTLIEYIGDAILACWNDRPESPVQNHAFAAASASFRMRLRLEELHPIWQKKIQRRYDTPKRRTANLPPHRRAHR